MKLVCYIQEPTVKITPRPLNLLLQVYHLIFLPNSLFSNDILFDILELHILYLILERTIHVMEYLLLIVSFYSFIERLALSRGRNPDLPPNLNKVTQTL